jgi:hypothetical protein
MIINGPEKIKITMTKSLKYVFFSVFILTLLSNCTKDDKSNGPEFRLKASDQLDELDYRLYSLIMGDMFTTSENLVVQQGTQPAFLIYNNPYYQSLLDEIPELDTTIFPDYDLKNDTVYFLGNKFDVASKEVSLVSNEEINYIFNTTDINSGWEKFYRRFPNSPGIISLSRIGYNTGKTQALVQMGIMYASLGGDGLMIYLRIENNKWKIIRTIPTWVS